MDWWTITLVSGRQVISCLDLFLWGSLNKETYKWNTVKVWNPSGEALNLSKSTEVAKVQAQKCKVGLRKMLSEEGCLKQRCWLQLVIYSTSKRDRYASKSAFVISFFWNIHWKQTLFFKDVQFTVSDSNKCNYKYGDWEPPLEQFGSKHLLKGTTVERLFLSIFCVEINSYQYWDLNWRPTARGLCQ